MYNLPACTPPDVKEMYFTVPPDGYFRWANKVLLDRLDMMNDTWTPISFAWIQNEVYCPCPNEIEDNRWTQRSTNWMSGTKTSFLQRTAGIWTHYTKHHETTICYIKDIPVRPGSYLTLGRLWSAGTGSPAVTSHTKMTSQYTWMTNFLQDSPLKQLIEYWICASYLLNCSFPCTLDSWGLYIDGQI